MGLEEDFKALCKKIPIERTKEDRKLRKKMFKEFDPNGNGLLSLAEVDKGIRDVLKLDMLFMCKPVLLRAFLAAKNCKEKRKERKKKEKQLKKSQTINNDKSIDASGDRSMDKSADRKKKRTKGKSKSRDKSMDKTKSSANIKDEKAQNAEVDPLARLKKLKIKRKPKKASQHDADQVCFGEFRMLLVQLRQQLELWILFSKIDRNKDRRIDLKEFRGAIDMLACWGIEVEDPERSFREIDVNGGGMILFEEFANWVISMGLDDDSDDEDDL